jgi:hypothetical protein
MERVVRNGPMTRKKIFCAIPVYGSISNHFLTAYTNLLGRPPFDLKLRCRADDSLIPRARNALTADFLETDCTHLLFIDSDILFTREHLMRIASHEVDIVGGIYPFKSEGKLKWCINSLVDAEEVRPDGLLEVRYVATGFMLIARGVFERMIEVDGPDIVYQHDTEPYRTEHDFWRIGVRMTEDQRRRYLSEDWFFCQRWLELGGEVYADTQVVLRHIGSAIFPLESQRDQIPLPGVAPES